MLDPGGIALGMVTKEWVPYRRTVDRFRLRFDVTSATNTGALRLHAIAFEAEAMSGSLFAREARVGIDKFPGKGYNIAMATPTASKKLKRPATSAAPAAPVQIGQANSGGTGTMQPLTPVVAAPQPAQPADVYNQGQSGAIQADLDRRGGAAQGGFAGSIAGMDLGGQFSAKPTPSTNQTAAGYLAAAPGTGAAGFAAPLAPARPVVGSGVAAPTGGFDLSNTPGTAPSKVETAVGQASDALGGAPQVDLGLADRRLGEYQESLGMSR